MERSWETREELLAAASAAGHEISPSQLGRLYRAGLVPSPQTHSLGRGKGTESRYPLGASVRLLRVLEIRAQEHRLAQTSWRIWWEDGGGMPPGGRAVLTHTAKVLDEQRDYLVRLVTGDQEQIPAAVAEMDRLYAAAEHGALSGPLAEVRKNVGRERFAAVIRTMGEIAAGQFNDETADEESKEALALVESALELGRARTDHLADAQPWLTGDVITNFSALSKFLSRSTLELADTDDFRLDLARTEIQSLIKVVSGAARLFEHLHGRGAFGFGLLARFFAVNDPRSQATALLDLAAAPRG